MYPITRMRRYRRTENIRRMLQEYHLHAAQLIYPLFVVEGENKVEAVDSMSGVYRYSLDRLLDEAGFEDVAIMSYAAKYASAFYGPFRDAGGSAPQFGDRKTYQMDPACSIGQAVLETALDVAEGCDYIIVKPALAYLDIMRMTREQFDQPIVAYQVSGEYAMIKAAAQNGWIDERRIVEEMMTSFLRAGAQMIITYHAIDLANWLKEEK